MKEIKLENVASKDLVEGAILNNEYQGFKEDYLVVHSLIRKYSPTSLMEVGTNKGTGTKIMCNANPSMKVYSLDLPYELADVSLSEGNHTGSYCKFPFTQLWGDSTEYDYSQHYPLEAWFIDGEHNYENPFKESKEAIKSGAKLIIWHDADMKQVYKAITDAFKGNKDYTLFRVIDTRIAYAVKK